MFSSQGWLEGCFGFDHCVEGDDEFPDNGDDNELVEFAVGFEPVSEGDEGWVVRAGREGGHEQGVAQRLAAAGDAGAVYGRAAFAGDRATPTRAAI
jgi:hypothetical protein